MNQRVPYKGLIIDAKAHELLSGLGWTYTFSIEQSDGQAVTKVPFFLECSPAQSNSEGALEAAIAHAKRSIDDGFTV